ncbi:MAG: hypothetical protein ACYC7A_20005 [Thermoanaerobaculia bacterium]
MNFSDLGGDRLRHFLDLAEEIQGRTLVIHAKPDITKRIRVYFQFETSMSVHEDGPHLDLLDWKHHTSDWVRLKGGPSYEIPLIPDEDERRFPPVTVEEIEAAIRERGEERWVEAMRRHPAGITIVSLSAIRLRITIDEDGHERVLYTIEFEVPMGC